MRSEEGVSASVQVTGARLAEIGRDWLVSHANLPTWSTGFCKRMGLARFEVLLIKT